MAISKRLRFEVLRRDNHTCKYCGTTADDGAKLTVDHVVPRALGGTDEPSNLVAACSDCNAGKAASNPDAPLVAEVDQRAAEWAQAMEIAIARRQAELTDERERTAAFDQAWRGWTIGGEEVPRDGNWRASVLRLLAAGLDDAFLVDAIGIAMRSKVKARDTWRYFCGVCWREIDKIQKAASALVTPLGTTKWVEDPTGASEARWNAVDGLFNTTYILLCELASAASGDTGRDAVRSGTLPVINAVKEEFDRLCAEQPETMDWSRDRDILMESWRAAAAAIHAMVDTVTHRIVPGNRMPYGPGLHPGFDALNLAESYIVELLDAAGAPSEVVAPAVRGFWDGMEAAYREFVDRLPDEPASEDCAVGDALMNAAHDELDQVRALCGTEEATDGAE